jgi:F-type H+-transporting ATPase subunit b
MKQSETSLLFQIMGIIGMLICFCPMVLASDGDTSSWRGTYDIVMKWVNFSILMFVILKYAGPPLMNFLRSHGREIERELATIEQEKSVALKELHTAREALEDSEARLDLVKERILEEGRKRKMEILQQAEEEGRNLVESATQRTQGYFQEAQRLLQHNLLDEAMNRAMELLPAVVTTADRENMVNDYISHLNEK